MNDPADPHLGIVNGASWYEVTGGMQDWNYVFGRCFEVTVEMNCAKFPRAAQLAAFWDEHKFALLHFLDLARQGLHGFVLDAQTGRGLPDVRISLGRGPLETRSFRHGDFWRPLLPGQYNVSAVRASRASPPSSGHLPAPALLPAGARADRARARPPPLLQRVAEGLQLRRGQTGARLLLLRSLLRLRSRARSPPRLRTGRAARLLRDRPAARPRPVTVVRPPSGS